jgi:hypothetical protein
MAILSRFGGYVNAVEFAYGVVSAAPPPLQVITGSTAAGTYTVTCQNQRAVANNAVSTAPTTNTPILVGVGTNEETVTPTSVSLDSLGNILITATFANAHSTGELVRSGTVGLQEALNYAASFGPGLGAEVIVDAGWAASGGTQAMITAAVAASTVDIVDNRVAGRQTAGNLPSSVTALAAPTAVSTAAALNGLLTTSSTGGSIAASAGTFRLGVTYVDQYGGETTLSIDTASAATIAIGSATSTNSIGLTSPAALAGAIGYKVYMTAAAGATLTEISYPAGNAAISGTAVASAPIPCFQIGTPVTITAIITGTAKVPAQNSAYAVATGETLNAPLTSYPPFTALGTIAAAATGTVGEVNFPAGFFNTLGRTVRVKGMGYATTNGTGGTITLEMLLSSIYGVTTITPFTVASPSVAASVITVSFVFEILAVTAAIGATGTLECHGIVSFNVAGTAVTSPAQDSVIAVSSTIDLTKQNVMSIAHLNTTLGTSASQLRQLTIEVLQ